MNWKIVVGALLVFGAIVESNKILKSKAADPSYNTGPAIAGCATLAVAGIALFLYGRRSGK